MINEGVLQCDRIVKDKKVEGKEVAVISILYTRLGKYQVYYFADEVITGMFPKDRSRGLCSNICLNSYSIEQN